MKTLIVYYSFDGNTRFIAQQIAKASGGELLELRVRSDQEPKHNFLKYLWGGKQVFQKEAPDLMQLDRNPADYDLVFVGTPVWAWTYAPALNSFFAQNTIDGKKIALFCCSGGGPGKTLAKMRERLSGSFCLGSIHFEEPLKRGKDSAARQAREWTGTIVELAGQ